MCGKSSFKIGNKNVDVFLGYRSGWLEIGDSAEYNKDNDSEKHKMKEKLASFTKEELIDAFIDMIDNAEEG